MVLNNERLPGYYWVRSGQNWLIAMWHKREGDTFAFWYAFDFIKPLDDSAFDEIRERIPVPVFGDPLVTQLYTGSLTVGQLVAVLSKLPPDLPVLRDVSDKPIIDGYYECVIETGIHVYRVRKAHYDDSYVDASEGWKGSFDAVVI